MEPYLYKIHKYVLDAFLGPVKCTTCVDRRLPWVHLHMQLLPSLHLYTLTPPHVALPSVYQVYQVMLRKEVVWGAFHHFILLWCTHLIHPGLYILSVLKSATSWGGEVQRNEMVKRCAWNGVKRKGLIRCTTSLSFGVEPKGTWLPRSGWSRPKGTEFIPWDCLSVLETAYQSYVHWILRGRVKLLQWIQLSIVSKVRRKKNKCNDVEKCDAYIYLNKKLMLHRGESRMHWKVHVRFVGG